MKYLFAAYRKSALAPMGEAFASSDLPAEEFKALFERTVLERYDAAWTLLAHTRKGFIPVGIVFAENMRDAAFMTVRGIVWFPWASRRNIIEALVGFMAGIRKQIPLVLYARREHKRAYEICCMHGLLNRVGTSYVIFPGRAPAAVFETKGAA